MSERTNIEKRIVQYLHDRLGFASYETDSMDSETNLQIEFGLDSLDTVELIMDLEAEYGIDIDDEYLDEIYLVVGKLEEFIKKTIEAKGQ